MKKDKRKMVKEFIFLHIVIFIYSLISVVSKIASNSQSFGFVIGYGVVLVLLGIYAILWQMVLQKQSLLVAFANKSVVIIWGILWGVLLYGETINLKKIIGAMIIILGIMCVVSENGQ